jgi:signal transduction histidine kinase
MDSKNIINDRGISHEELKLIRFLKFNELEYSRIINAISHDISNPVATLKSNIQLLRNNLSSNEKELNAEILCMCDESIEELVRFLDNIRLVNSVIKSSNQPKFSLFEIEHILSTLFLDLETVSLDHRRITVQTNLEFKEFSSDLDFLRRILLNLLTNALKFSRAEVILGISSIQSNLEFVIQDFGIGIPEDEIDQIFNPFYRGTNVKNTPGIGLGLSIVKVLIETLGGQLFLHSLIGQGTIIRIVIPNGCTN